MGLFKYILQGFGHTLGSEAARDALKKVDIDRELAALKKKAAAEKKK